MKIENIARWVQALSPLHDITSHEVCSFKDASDNVLCFNYSVLLIQECLCSCASVIQKSIRTSHVDLNVEAFSIFVILTSIHFACHIVVLCS